MARVGCNHGAESVTTRYSCVGRAGRVAHLRAALSATATSAFSLYHLVDVVSRHFLYFLHGCIFRKQTSEDAEMSKGFTLVLTVGSMFLMVSNASAGPRHHGWQQCCPAPACEVPTEPYGGGTWLQSLANQVGQLRSEFVRLQNDVTRLRTEVDTLRRQRQALQSDLKSQAAISRHWTDKSMTKSAAAQLVRVAGDRAYFRRADGGLASSAVANLSAADQQWIRVWEDLQRVARAATHGESR